MNPVQLQALNPVCLQAHSRLLNQVLIHPLCRLVNLLSRLAVNRLEFPPANLLRSRLVHRLDSRLLNPLLFPVAFQVDFHLLSHQFNLVMNRLECLPLSLRMIHPVNHRLDQVRVQLVSPVVNQLLYPVVNPLKHQVGNHQHNHHQFLLINLLLSLV